MRRALLAVILAACSSPGPSTSPASAPLARALRLGGRVTEAGGAPLAGVRVTAAGQSAQTGSDGRFQLDGVPEGTQLVTATAAGHHVEVAAVQAGAADVELALASSAGNVELVFGGDLAFQRRAAALPGDRAGFARLWAEAAPLFTGADIAVVTLESALGESGAPHPSRPRVVSSPLAAIGAFTALGIDVVALHGEHAFDRLDEGLADGLEALRGAGLATLGAGLDDREAYAPLVIEKNGVRVGLVALSAITGRGEETGVYQPPFADATAGKAGVARLDVARLDAALADLRGRADRIVVLLHGGREGDAAPDNDVANAARRAIDGGADLVVASHPRVVAGVEQVQGKLVFYGLGALAFEDDRADGWRGALLRVRLGKSGPPTEVRLEPIYSEGLAPAAATGRLARAIVDTFAERSARLGVTVLPDGDRGRVIAAPPGDLPASDSAGSLEAPAVSGDGATLSFEALLAPGQYLARVDAGDPPGATLWLGRELLATGDFEDVLADGAFAAPSGWRFPSTAEQLVAGDAESGQLSLAVCRSGTARDVAAAESTARVPLPASGSVSLCGCWRGDAGTTGAARVVFWSSLDEDARPLDSRPAVEGAPPAQWGCFCRAAAGPANARFASVRLEHTPTADHTACVRYDRVRLIGWEMSERPGAALELPNRYAFARMTGVGNASSAGVSYTLRALGAP